MNAQGNLLFFVLGVNAVLSQGMPITRACAGENVTLEFKPVVNESLTIQTFVWQKLALKGDTSFAKFTNKEKNFDIYPDDVQGGRLIHNHNDKSEINNLILKNIRKSDSSQYVLVIRYTTFTSKDPEYVMQLEVKDVCFEAPKQEGGCAVSTCFTGDNGMLKLNNDSGSIVKVDGYKMVKVCENSRDHKIHPTVGMVNYTDSIHYMYPQLAASGNYSCCNADGVCMEQVFQILDWRESGAMVNDTDWRESGAMVNDTEKKEEEVKDGGVSVITAVVIMAILVVVGVVMAVLLILQRMRVIHLPCVTQSNQGNDAEGQPLRNGNEAA
ncbi:uncharacterized protein LOC125671578 isoform X4 [Ostrea edulis]|uniref:uncharacterized protein LOC125671578 isoform X4 n=2 Tax=Ostrea edulis TaxID=37623 RepID=UPI002095B674|nr:uncharacterized protein LOC125671578 isoform X4 [Ostrea edulis]